MEQAIDFNLTRRLNASQKAWNAKKKSQPDSFLHRTTIQKVAKFTKT